MNSGRWDENGKVRPGTYVNVDSAEKEGVTYAQRGIAVVPLMTYGWGPDDTILSIEAKNITAYDAELGCSVFDNIMLKEAFIGAAKVLVYINNKGTKATKTITVTAAHDDDPAVEMTATAAYNGTRGNDLKVVCTANADSTFLVEILLGTNVVESFDGLTKLGDVVDAGSKYIVFTTTTPTASLAAFASQSLTGGTSTAATNTEWTDMLDKFENIKWNTMACPITTGSLQQAVISKIKHLRDDCGKSVQAVLPSASASDADYEGIINLINSVKVDDGTENGKSLTISEATCFVAGVTAGADELTSNTYLVHPGAIEIIGDLTNEQAEAAIKEGKMFFSYNDDNEPHIEYDINSLHTFTATRAKSFSKNKVIRVLDALADTIRLTFQPNKFDNGPVGWACMTGLGKEILKHYGDVENGIGAITDVDTDNDFVVDTVRSTGDSVFVNVGCKPVDAAEKLYFQVITR